MLVESRPNVEIQDEIQGIVEILNELAKLLLEPKSSTNNEKYPSSWVLALEGYFT
jgi:hypothetical protein